MHSIAVHTLFVRKVSCEKRYLTLVKPFCGFSKRKTVFFHHDEIKVFDVASLEFYLVCLHYHGCKNCIKAKEMHIEATMS